LAANLSLSVLFSCRHLGDQILRGMPPQDLKRRFAHMPRLGFSLQGVNANNGCHNR